MSDLEKDSLTETLSVEARAIVSLRKRVEEGSAERRELRREIDAFKSDLVRLQKEAENAKETLATFKAEIATLKEGKSHSEKLLWGILSGVGSLLLAALGAWLGGVFGGKK